MMAGYIKLHRGWRDCEAFESSTYSEGDAWIWLIENAAWKPTSVRIKGKPVKLDRGELSFSQRFMATAWGWSKSRVDRFIGRLRDAGMIETRTKSGAQGGATAGHPAGQGQSIISICNYVKYQDDNGGEWGNNETQGGATAGQQRGKEEELKERKKNRARAAARPDDVSESVWTDFLTLRRTKRAPLTDTALAAIQKEAERANWTLESALTECVARGWQGFKADWVHAANDHSEAEKYGDVW